MRPGETAFINERLKYTMAGMPTDRTRLLQIARGVCQSLAGGTSSNNIVAWMAKDLGASEAETGQMFIMIQDSACAWADAVGELRLRRTCTQGEDLAIFPV